MSNVQTGAERIPHDLSHLVFEAGKIGRLKVVSWTPVVAGDSFELDMVGALRLSPCVVDWLLTHVLIYSRSMCLIVIFMVMSGFSL